MTGAGALLLLLLLQDDPAVLAGAPATEGGGGFVGPAARLRPFISGPNTVTPTAGANNLALLIPAAEPLSVGLPPVQPVLGRRISVPYRVRRVGVRSGQTAALALDVAPRPRFQVVWDGLVKADRDALLAWIAEELEGTRFAFDLEVEGPGSTPVTVRPVADALDEWMDKAAYRISLEVEEVF